MDEALIQNSQHDVDHQDGHSQQHAQPAQRLLEGLRAALEAGGDGQGQRVRRQPRNLIHRVANGYARLQVEGDGYRGQLSHVVHRQRPQVRNQLGYGAQRYQLPVGAPNVQVREHLRIALVFVLQLHDHPVLIVGRVDGGDLPLAVGGVERVFDLLWRYSQRRSFVAVNFHVGLRVLDLQVSGHVLQPWQGRSEEHTSELQ